MIFYSKIDRKFIFFIGGTILILAVACFFPFFLIDEEVPLAGAIILSITFFVSAGLILWNVFGVAYIFYEDYLLVRGGFFRSLIPYNEISLIAKADSILSGYRVLSSTDAIELFYKKGFMGSVKISPKNEREFIELLKERCPYLMVDETLES